MAKLCALKQGHLRCRYADGFKCDEMQACKVGYILLKNTGFCFGPLPAAAVSTAPATTGHFIAGYHF
jgi:hypothetical protein